MRKVLSLLLIMALVAVDANAGSSRRNVTASFLSEQLRIPMNTVVQSDYPERFRAIINSPEAQAISNKIERVDYSIAVLKLQLEEEKLEAIPRQMSDDAIRRKRQAAKDQADGLKSVANAEALRARAQAERERATQLEVAQQAQMARIKAERQRLENERLERVRRETESRLKEQAEREAQAKLQAQIRAAKEKADAAEAVREATRFQNQARQSQTAVKPVVQPQVEEKVAPIPRRQAEQLPPIWRNDEMPGDQGKVYYQTAEFCKPIVIEDSPLRVSEFFSETRPDADFENLRTTGEFISTGANVKALVPQGSLVLINDDKSDEYRKILVISRAHYNPEDLEAHHKEFKSDLPVALYLQSGYLHRDSLAKIQDYTLRLGSNRFTQYIKSMGIDLDDASLRASVNKGGEINGLNCCVGKSCEQFITFDIVNAEEDKLSAKQIAISPNIASILQTVTAQPNEEDHGDEEAEEGDKQTEENTTTATGGQGSGSATGDQTVKAGDQATKTDGETIAGVPVSGTSPTKVVCLEDGSANVRVTNSRGVLISKPKFTVKNNEPVLIRQGFEGTRKKFNGEDMIEVQFPNLKSKGWIAEKFLLTESACTAKKSGGNGEGSTTDPKTNPAPGSSLAGGIFPTMKRPAHSYVKGGGTGGWFGASRRKGKRTHAACDLFRPEGEPARAIWSGRVIQGPYDYYEGTYALEVKHDNGKVVLYGEISKRRATGITPGARVSQGQIVGYIKRVYKSKKIPMLHTEFYTGNGRGPLTQRKRKPFERRSDLMDPTQILRGLERKTFGKSY